MCSSPDPAYASVRRARETDAPAIAEIYNDAVRTTVATFDTEPRTMEAQLDWFRHHDDAHPVYVAEMDGTTVGWASLSPWSDRRAYDRTAEFSFYVATSSRGRGIGRQLLSVSVGAGDDLGLHTILARIADGNAISLHLHGAFGFRIIGVMREVGFKFGRLIDVQLLQRMSGAGLEHRDSVQPDPSIATRARKVGTP